jgi:hypothetical protein
MAEGGLLLTVTAGLGFLWPRVLAWPLAAISLWLGLALLTRSARRRAHTLPGSEGRSHTLAPQPVPAGDNDARGTQKDTEVAR